MDNCESAKWNTDRKTGMEAVYLAACALNGQRPVVDASIDLPRLYKFCKFQSITAIVAVALEELWRSCPPEDPDQMKPWKQAKDMAIRKAILLNAERERILAHLESIGCWYMPLKGSLLQYDYPKFGMREMSDNDILYDVGLQSAVYDFMCASQYEPVLYQVKHHDEYQKLPVYNFEMHTKLLNHASFPVQSAYYTDPKRLMIKDEGNQFGFHLSDEDFYIYMTVHAYRHYASAGIGIRNLTDVYVFLRKHGEGMDWAYLEKELRHLQVWEFDCACRNLSEKLFAQPQQEIALSDEEMQILDTFFQSGTYGTQQQRIDKALSGLKVGKKKAGLREKFLYFLRRAFPPVEVMYVEYPQLKQKKWKLPFMMVWRLMKAIISKPRTILRELAQLFKSKSGAD